ncbi:unnamed protein product [Hyaloperonospora brassicae]|uniref:Uncharacterized protein n=1 Tax=Hyaloperonospora brassicae TaxID=162125 RepID=A0AAV0T8L2_HYABA|nr:unnamed protein product [Hyaloperonospora brassicae]
MTNIPFEREEAQYGLVNPTTTTPPPAWSRKYFRSALRVDQVLLGDWASISSTLDVFKLPYTLAGARLLLEKWIDMMKPEYFMAGVPISFESSDEILLQVPLPLAEEKELPIALKFDSVLSNNACYECLATLRSLVKQHEVTVEADKFRILHLYGCWWYCNNPSIIEELTRMRIETLSTALTSQRLDTQKLFATGWKMSKSGIQRDVQRLFGQSHEEFMTKSM